MVISWNLNSVPSEISTSVFNINTAYEIWTDLNECSLKGMAHAFFTFKSLFLLFLKANFL